LFLREAVHRLFGGRGAWVWLLLEPAVHVVVLMVIFAVIRVRVISGIETAIWIMVGMVAYFMFRRVASQAMNGIVSNQSLFTYRQVKPVDTVLARAGLEGLLMVLVAFLLFSGGALVGLDVIPADPLFVLEAFLGLWLLGLGFGLIVSVLSELVPEVGKVISLLMTPLYFMSGAIFPIAVLPTSLRELLMLNPVAHALEAARMGFAPYYQAAPELSMGYVHFFALVMICAGLALHVRFAEKVIAK
jgi:capsular polysaccharide transport system permease protein